MLSLSSSLSISFNSSKHFHLYGSNASMAQVSLPPQKPREQRRAKGWEEPQGRARRAEAGSVGSQGGEGWGVSAVRSSSQPEPLALAQLPTTSGRQTDQP